MTTTTEGISLRDSRPEHAHYVPSESLKMADLIYRYQV
jgi:hypothetical protein